LSSEKIAFALRPGVFSPKEIGEISTVLDKNSKVTRIFIPDIRSGFESLEVVSSILAVTTRVRAGSGVIRLLEHDPALLTRRVQTLQAFSSNRFFLGVGTGPPGPEPSKSVIAMLERLDQLKKGFRALPGGVEPRDLCCYAQDRDRKARCREDGWSPSEFLFAPTRLESIGAAQTSEG